MPEYTMLTVMAVILVVVADLWWLRTRLVTTAHFWCGYAIMAFFQIWVDGWLTKLHDPIVIYNPAHHSGIRFPFDIPIEDFGFGFAMILMTLMLWTRAQQREATP